MGERLLIDLGGGKNPVTFEGRWKVMDVLKHVDYVQDLNRGEAFPLKDNTVAHYYCSHTLEHVDPRLTVFTLKEMHRTLIPGGRVRIVVPDAMIAIQLYLKNMQNGPHKKYPAMPPYYPATAFGKLFAWFVTPDKSVQSGHKMGFDKETLDWYLKEAGFSGRQHMGYRRYGDPVFEGKDYETYACNSIYMEGEK